MIGILLYSEPLSMDDIRWGGEAQSWCRNYSGGEDQSGEILDEEGEPAEAAPAEQPGTESEATPEAAPAPETESQAEAAPQPVAVPEAQPEPEEEEEEDHHVLEGSAEGAIAIISDVDMLFDYFLGDPERGAGRVNNNVDFIMNLVEYLVGDEDLRRIRGRDSTNRPFTAINEIRERAAKKTQAKRAEIRKEIEQANQSLQAGQELQDIGGGIAIRTQSEESIKAFRKAEQTIIDKKREENKVNREQRKEIQAAINAHKWSNMLLTPALVIIIGLLVGFKRKMKTAAK